MALKALLRWHYFTVQTIEAAPIDQGGAVNRSSAGYVTKYTDIKGHLQSTLTSSSKGRNDVVVKFGLREFEIYWTLYHNNIEIQNILNSGHRILIHKDPRKPLPGDKTLIRIFEVISAREPVAIRGKKTLFEVYLKEVKHQKV